MITFNNHSKANQLAQLVNAYGVLISQKKKKRVRQDSVRVVILKSRRHREEND